MESIDLNLDNYGLNDLLKMFKLNQTFNERDLKNAKKIVLNMHPDKSHLDKKYFLFFSRAFKQLLKIYEFKKGSTNKVDDYKDIESTHDEDTEAEHKLLLDSYMKLAPKEFNNWFNTMWLETEQTGETSATDLKLNGYGDWLKSGAGCADMGEFAGLSKDDKIALLNKKKRAMSSLVKHQEFGEMMNTSNQSLLCRDEVGGYQSDVFSKLQYDDLKHAHEESIIPVSEEDGRASYSNVEDIKRFRNRQQIKPLDEQECNEYQERKAQKDNNIGRAYKLIKEDESVNKMNDIWWSKVKHIDNQ